MRRIGTLAIAALASLSLFGVPSTAAAATDLVALELHLSAPHVAIGAPVLFYGSVTRVSGTPRDVRVDLELPASYTSGTCTPSCVGGTRFEWLFSTVTGRTTFRLSTTWTGLGESARLFLAGGSAGCATGCPAEVDLLGAAPTTSAHLDYTASSPVVSGSTIVVNAAVSANAAPINGTLTVQLPSGVGVPSVSGDVTYTGDPVFRVEGPISPGVSGFAFGLPITAPDGSSLTFQAWFTPASGYGTTVNASLTFTVGPDSTPPKVTGPTATLISGPNLYGVPIRLAWTATDTGAGVERSEIFQQTDGGAWKLVGRTQPSTDPTTFGRTLTAGHRYRFRVRAIDHAGNVGGWAYGSTFTLAGHQETSSAIRYAGTWSTVRWGGYAGDQARSGVAGSTARFTTTSRSVSWLSLRGPTRGRATVYVNGTKMATVDLWASELQPRVVWAMSWSTVATRTITVQVRRVYGRPRVELDAFYTLR